MIVLLGAGNAGEFNSVDPNEAVKNYNHHLPCVTGACLWTGGQGGLQAGSLWLKSSKVGVVQDLLHKGASARILATDPGSAESDMDMQPCAKEVKSPMTKKMLCPAAKK